MPMLVTLSLRRVGLKKTFLFFAVLIVVPLVLSMNLDVDGFVEKFAGIMKAAESEAAAPAAVAAELGFADLLTDQFVILCCLAFLFHVPVEACVATWATTLMNDVLLAGLSSTAYQQTDDTSARVKGEFWHTHILCNPFYTWYSTRPHKDRLALLGVLTTAVVSGETAVVTCRTT